mmetsp:Transcript_8274/g.13698  ORF Transcript_8274/g.13698 Transcript_8274/m.13698 type:complete len:80 (-) Transcript_8274:2335-2574(-)
MKFLCFATLLAAANAFTTAPSVISSPKVLNNVVAEPSAHRNRRATIVMDGKANGKATRVLYGAVNVAYVPQRTEKTRTR